MRVLALLFVLGCVKQAPVVEAEPLPTAGELALPVVTKAADMRAVDGKRVELEGTIVRAVAQDNEPGTAIELADGTRIFVAFGEPPHGWEYLIGAEVRVEGTLRIEPGGGIEVPILDQPDAPLPAGVGLESTPSE